jgi:hypothetical protein
VNPGRFLYSACFSLIAVYLLSHSKLSALVSDISCTSEHYVFEMIISAVLIFPKALISTIKIEIEAIRSILARKNSS